MNNLFSTPTATQIVCALCLAASTWMCTAQTQKKAPEIYFDNENRDENSPWEETKWELPAFPIRDNLLNFYVSPASSLQFSVDATSLKVGNDNVVRFTLVITSRTGASNISYEGIRCATRERRTYATGRQREQSWSIIPRSTWKPIEYVHNNNHFAVLASEYFCDIHTLTTGGQEEMLRRLKNAHRESSR